MVRDLDAEELRAPWTLTAEELKRAAGKRDANALAFAVLARVLSGPEAAGCLKVYKDTATGTKAARPQWIRCLDDLRTGDTLVIWKIDRLGRNLRDLIDIITTLESRGVGVQSLTNGIVDTTTAHGKLVFGMFALMAE